MIKIISAAILGLLLVSCGPPQDGHGTREYNNGTYVGEWKDGNMHGQGTFTSTKGTQYVGAWKHGKMHGEGTYTFASGNQYRGKWKNDSQWTGKEYDKDGNILSTITNGSNLLAVIEENVTNRLASGGADYDKGMAAYKSGDYSTALRYMRPLAEQGNADAQHNLGVMYGDGDGVPQDDKTTLKWWTLAAEQGRAKSQFNLGWLYERGDGVPQDYKTAVKWYTLAAEQGDADAQLNLGGMYGKGRGVLQDNIYAHMWVHIAASSGDTDASSYRDEIAKEMTPAQIEKAEKLARECVAKKYKGC